ncbi:hypothetical protein PPERSA_01698 [Pseudocohnilembus persalinus]|uniref:Rhomboid-like protease n=1 Tax=Pseudocohnilembus persalinus TaxID=266149 RepID=A0A0V0R0V2_PSEPJ|nr:hypothetical protein PPERSA_01698 [Pseudocohnilembus persalinus]|eukprot:KRX08153.1 hypothetical protein PPERSA_01698 [Pseudocohnilembus persalinus]
MQLTLVDQEEKENSQKKQPNNQTKKHPRNETFTDMIKLQIFYYLKPKSFTFIILIIDTIVYLISLLYDGVDISNGFLAPTQKALFDLGEIFPYYQKNSGIFGYLRIFTSIFLHANFLQFVSSIFIKVYFLQFIENQIGHLNTAKLYFQSCIFGTLFQSLISDDFGVAGATGVGVISFGLNLEYRQFQPKSGQFFYYHNHQQTQTFGLLKMLGIMLYFYLIYISYPNCLCINILGALIGKPSAIAIQN